MLINKIKKAELLCCFSAILVPPSTLTKEKHEQFTPKGREPSSLVLSVEYWRYLNSENKDLKSN